MPGEAWTVWFSLNLLGQRSPAKTSETKLPTQTSVKPKEKWFFLFFLPFSWPVGQRQLGGHLVLWLTNHIFLVALCSFTTASAVRSARSQSASERTALAHCYAISSRDFRSSWADSGLDVHEASLTPPPPWLCHLQTWLVPPVHHRWLKWWAEVRMSVVKVLCCLLAIYQLNEAKKIRGNRAGE